MDKKTVLCTQSWKEMDRLNIPIRREIQYMYKK